MIPVPQFMSENIFCCVCDNTDPKSFSLAYQKTNYAVCVCNNCKHYFIPPHYRKKIIYTQYKNSDVTDAVKQGNNWLKVQRHKLRFKFIKKYISTGNLFDLGAGWGHFMLAGKELGYNVSGIEISEQPYLYCVNELKLPVRHINFFDMPEAEKFDCVTLWDVLEHIDDASPFLQKINSITKVNGFLFLQVPQIDSYISKKYKDDWKMMGLDHVNYFSKNTITKILEKNGYKVLKIKSSFELKLFLMYTVLPYIKKVKSNSKSSTTETNKTISSSERQQYFNKVTKRPMWQLKLFVVIHNMIYNFLSFINIGEEMMVAAIKVKDVNPNN
ncbi:MAG: class I SAM-dependent methyltransferase [Bacteroidetes bacterium]|nr:class I SAM-dependent methyltransferase [Bacteroidota bacterium]